MTKAGSPHRELLSGNTPATRPTNNAYFPALDGIRAIAFLMVFGVHYLALPWGFTGVDAFFVLSGFLITGILYDTRDDPHRVRNFYLRRTLRIFPLYYGIFLLLLLTYPIFRWQWNWTWLLWPTYLGNYARFIHPYPPGSMLQMMADAQPLSRTFPHVQLFLGHFWSLCVEEQFYLLWPWCVFWIKDRKQLIYLCLAAIVLCPIARAFAPDYLPQFMLAGQVTLRATPFRLDALLLGGLVALIRRGPHAQKLLLFARIGFALLLTGMVLWHVMNRPLWHSFRGYNHPSWVFTWGMAYVDLFFTCLIVMALEFRSATFHLFNFAPLRWLGRLTYGAYVFHDIPHLLILRVVQQAGLPPIRTTAAVALSLTILVSWASYHFIEKRFISMKDRWTR